MSGQSPWRLLSQLCKADDVYAVSRQIDHILQTIASTTGAGVADRALGIALRHGNHHLVTYLLDQRGASTSELTPSSLASAPSIPLLETAVAHGFDINSVQVHGEGKRERLLQRIVDNEGLVRWCLDHGANVEDPVLENEESMPPRTLLETAAGAGSVATFKLLRSKGAKMGRKVLHYAASAAAAACMEHSLQDGREERMAMLRLLVEEERCDVNALDVAPEKPLPMHPGTPLAYVAKIGDAARPVVEYLLEKGADPRIKDGFGLASALDIARRDGCQELVRSMEEWIEKQAGAW